MKNFTHRFRLIPPKSIRSQWMQNVDFVPDAPVMEFMASNPVLFEQTTETDESGTYTAATFSAVVKDRAAMAANGCRAVLELTLSDGSVRYVGTKEDAPIIKVTPYLDRFALSVDTKLLHPVEL